MRFALALATIAVAVIAGPVRKPAILVRPPKGVNFGNALNSVKAWGSFKAKTGNHSRRANVLMAVRNRAVTAWFAAKNRAATAASRSAKAAARANGAGAHKRAMRVAFRFAAKHAAATNNRAKKAAKAAA